MDLSNIEKDVDIGLAMDTWKRKMVVLPRNSQTVSIVTIAYSAKAILGALGTLISLK